MTFEEAMGILEALEYEGVDYVLVGSMAMAVQGIVRATRDIDIFVSPAAENVERLKEALHSLYDDPSIDEISAEDLGGDFPAIQYTPPHGRFWLDILARLGDAFRYDDLDWETLDIEGITVRVATPRMLHRMKKDTVRPQDRADAARIREVFELDREG